MFKIFKSLSNKTSSFDKKGSIVIKIPVSKWKRAYSWGDTHMAILLKKQLELLGYKVLIQVRSEWYNREGKKYDTVIVFRGLKEYKPSKHQKNIMWNISHPDKISLEEYDSYDFVYIASNYWKKIIAKQISVPVEAMLQCTDPKRFKPFTSENKHPYYSQLLFVGNSRGVFREIIQDLLPTKYQLSVYGQKWENMIPKSYLKGEYIENDELYKHYSSADILLNDHWDDMKNKGFVSNRIFDGLACKTFIISDNVEEMGELSNYIKTYTTKEELNNYINYFLSHPIERIKLAEKGYEHILNKHTFRHRALELSTRIELLN